MSRTTYTLAQSAEHAGNLMGSDLINELLQLKGKPQIESLQAVHDKIYALSMLQPFDAAAGGFAVALVNVLQIGIANLEQWTAGKEYERDDIDESEKRRHALRMLGDLEAQAAEIRESLYGLGEVPF